MNSSLQLRELMIAYSLTAGAMLVGLLLMRADSRAYFRWPVYSVMVMALGVVLWNLARKHLITDAWLTSHAELVYYGARALYPMLGFSVGLALGRLTRTAASSRSTPA